MSKSGVRAGLVQAGSEHPVEAVEPDPELRCRSALNWSPSGRPRFYARRGPPGRASVRRCVVSRNRPLAALAPHVRIFSLRKTILPPGRPVCGPLLRVAVLPVLREPTPPGPLNASSEGRPMTPDTPATPVRAQHATLNDLATLLRDQQARKVDIVAPAARSAPRRTAGSMTPRAAREDGVTTTAGAYTPPMSATRASRQRSHPSSYLGGCANQPRPVDAT